MSKTAAQVHIQYARLLSRRVRDQFSQIVNAQDLPDHFQALAALVRGATEAVALLGYGNPTPRVVLYHLWSKEDIEALLKVPGLGDEGRRSINVYLDLLAKRNDDALQLQMYHAVLLLKLEPVLERAYAPRVLCVPSQQKPVDARQLDAFGPIAQMG